MGPLNTFEYSMDTVSEEGYNELWQSSRLSWYCSEDFDDTRLQSAFSDMGLTEDSDEGRLSRALQSWMPDYVITPIEPMEKPPMEPVFTGKLGKDREKVAKINLNRRRVPSAVRQPRTKSEKSVIQKSVPSSVRQSGSKREQLVIQKRVPSAVKQSRTKNEKSFIQKQDLLSERSSNKTRFKCTVSESKTINKSKPQNISEKKSPRDDRIRRTPSYDSLSTHYSSLFEISSFEETNDFKPPIQRHRKRGKHKQESANSVSPEPGESKWEKLARRKQGAFDKFSRIQNALRIDTLGIHKSIFESEAFELMDPDERNLLFNCAKQTGIRLTRELKKSESTTTLNRDGKQSHRTKIMRVLSMGHLPLSKGFNIEEAKQQLDRERMAELRKKQHVRVGRLRRRSSRIKVYSARSDKSSSMSCTTPSMRSFSPATTQDTKPEAMWKGDKEILEMDLRRGLTSRVQKRIKTTTSALERVTGYGQNNSFRKLVGRCPDFPQFIDDDYGLRPKIVQRMRISPNLSNVIREDIKVRMGRPRYHEIKVKDLEWWNRGQSLDRSHRNLKVFNWLHSLREDEFEHFLDIEIIDKPPESTDDVGVMHVEAADEPDIKPLHQTDFFKSIVF